MISEMNRNEFLIEFVYNSEAIEGCEYNLDTCKNIIMKGGLNVGPISDQWIKQIRTHYFLANTILQKDPYIHIADLKSYHEQLFKGVLFDAGNFRVMEAYITGSDAVLAKASYIYRLLADFLTKYNDFSYYTIKKSDKECYLEPIYKGIGFRHWNYERIHPFSDGNGRTGRLLMLHDMNRHSVPLKMIKLKYVGDYYRALESEETFGEWFSTYE